MIWHEKTGVLAGLGRVVAGGLAGLVALALDVLLDLLLLGHVLPVALRLVAAYAAAGALVAALLELPWWRRGRDSEGERAAAVLALLYAPPLFERLFFALEFGMGTAVAVAAGALGLVGYGVWAYLLVRVAQSRSAGRWVAAMTVAVFLGIHRNLIEGSPIRASLLAATVVGALGLVGARLGRPGGRRGGWELAGLAGLVGGAALTMVVAGNGWRSGAEGGRLSRSPGPSQNLVLVVVDTLRQDVFESVVAETEEGRAFRDRLPGAVWFDHAVAAAPWTSPSVASILTGLYPAEHGFAATSLADGLPDGLPTLAEALTRSGYRTEALVANPILYPASGIFRGFGRHEVLAGATRRLPLLGALARSGWVREDLYQDAAVVRRRLSPRLADLGAGRPFFLWLLLMDPHTPWRPHPGLSSDPGAVGLPAPERLYRDEVRFALRELTRIIDRLAEQGLWNDTWLVLVSDHGEAFPTDEPGVATTPEAGPATYGRHGHALDRELLRVPLIVRSPRAAGPIRRVGVLASHVDLHDTILDLLAVDAPRIGGERVSLAPWVTAGGSPPGSPRTAALASFGSPVRRALETVDHKLIDRTSPGPGEPGLYDVATDPGEDHNLAEARPELTAELLRQLEDAWSRLAPSQPPSPATYDPATLERLRALGYVH